MKSPPKSQVLIIIGLFLILPGILQKPLRLPEWSAAAFPFAALIFIGTGAWLQLRAKRRGEIRALTPREERKVMRIAILTVIVASILSPFLLRYIGLGVHVTLGGWVLLGILASVIGLATVLLGIWLRRKV